MGRRWWSRGGDGGSDNGGDGRPATTAVAADAATSAQNANNTNIIPLPGRLSDIRGPPTLGQRRRARASGLRQGLDRVEDTTEELLMGRDPEGGGAAADQVRAAGYGRPVWQETFPSPDPDASPGAAVDFVRHGLALPPKTHARLKEAAESATRKIQEAVAAGFPPRERERAEAGADLRRWRRRAGVRRDGEDAQRSPGPETESDLAALAADHSLARRFQERVAARTAFVRGRGEDDVAWLKHKAYTRGLAAIRAARLCEEEDRRRAVEGGGGGGRMEGGAGEEEDEDGGEASSSSAAERRRRYLASKGAPLDVIPAEVIDMTPMQAAAEAARGARLTSALEAEARRLGLLAPTSDEEGVAAVAAAPAAPAVRPCCAAKRAADEAAERSALAAAAAVPAGGVWADDPAVREGVVAELRARGVLKPPQAPAPPPSPAATMALPPPAPALSSSELSDPSMAVYTREHRAHLRALLADKQAARARRLAFVAGAAGAALARLALAWLRRRQRRQRRQSPPSASGGSVAPSTVVVESDSLA
jgi:hypothetical protein